MTQEPSLQNIPIRTALGAKIRKLFRRATCPTSHLPEIEHQRWHEYFGSTCPEETK